MGIGPAHHNLEDVVQFGEGCRVCDLNTPPDGWFAVVQGDLQLIDGGWLTRRFGSHGDPPAGLFYLPEESVYIGCFNRSLLEFSNPYFDTDMVVDNKPVCYQFMILIGFGKRQCFADKAAQPLSQGIVPTFLVRRFPAFFSNSMMRPFGQHGLISLPKIAVATTPPLSSRNRGPQTPTGRFATVTDDKRYDLPCSTA
jgi:hypothetical protein